MKIQLKRISAIPYSLTEADYHLRNSGNISVDVYDPSELRSYLDLKETDTIKIEENRKEERFDLFINDEYVGCSHSGAETRMSIRNELVRNIHQVICDSIPE